jgi:hypothetical protein
LWRVDKRDSFTMALTVAVTLLLVRDALSLCCNTTLPVRAGRRRWPAPVDLRIGAVVRLPGVCARAGACASGVAQASSVRFVELGLVPDTDDVFKDVARFSGLHTVRDACGVRVTCETSAQFEGVTILRFDAPLFFANVKHFEQMLAQRARAHRESTTYANCV